MPGCPIDCDDSKVCTADSCDAKKGCGYSNNKAACNDNNGCTTGDGEHGLWRAPAITGAQSVVLSLWPVDDEAMRALMQRFYAAWKSGQSRAGALRTAQAAMRAEARWQHRYFWEAFVSSGAE